MASKISSDLPPLIPLSSTSLFSSSPDMEIDELFVDSAVDLNSVEPILVTIKPMNAHANRNARKAEQEYKKRFEDRVEEMVRNIIKSVPDASTEESQEEVEGDDSIMERETRGDMDRDVDNDGMEIDITEEGKEDSLG